MEERERGKGLEETTPHGEHTAHTAGDVLLSCTLDTDTILLTNPKPINSIKGK